MPSTLSNEELQRMKAKLDQEVIDDAEELLNWFGAWGSVLIEEVLTAREERCPRANLTKMQIGV